MSTKFWVITAGAMFVIAVLFTSLFFVERASHAVTSAECEKREALIKAADDHASAIEASLDAEREKRADLEYEYERLEAKYNNVRKPKKANAFSNLPAAARADSLRSSINSAVRR